MKWSKAIDLRDKRTDQSEQKHVDLRDKSADQSDPILTSVTREQWSVIREWSKAYWPLGQESSDQSDPMGGHGHSAVGHHCSYVEMSCWMRAHYLLIKLAPCWSADLPKVAAEWINYRRIQSGVWINPNKIHAGKSRLVFRLTQIESMQENTGLCSD